MNSQPPTTSWTVRGEVVTALRAIVVFSVGCGLAYPLAMTGVAAIVFPHRAAGSLLERDGQVVGSELVGQPFADPAFFWSRPSATAIPYDGGASSGSNYGPNHPDFRRAIVERIDAIRAANPDAPGAIPIDLVTASGSGLDPHISVAAAYYQVPRIARARRLSQNDVLGLIDAHSEGSVLGIVGEPRVNVMTLNLALADLTAGAQQ